MQVHRLDQARVRNTMSKISATSCIFNIHRLILKLCKYKDITYVQHLKGKLVRLLNFPCHIILYALAFKYSKLP